MRKHFRVKRERCRKLSRTLMKIRTLQRTLPSLALLSWFAYNFCTSVFLSLSFSRWKKISLVETLYRPVYKQWGLDSRKCSGMMCHSCWRPRSRRSEEQRLRKSSFEDPINFRKSRVITIIEYLDLFPSFAFYFSVFARVKSQNQDTDRFMFVICIYIYTFSENMCKKYISRVYSWFHRSYAIYVSDSSNQMSIRRRTEFQSQTPEQ